MRRRGGSERPAKRRRTTKLGIRQTPTARLTSADLQGQVATLTRELREAREQQIATSEVLQVISQSSGKLEPVFEAMLENATRICDASHGVMFLREGKGFRTAAMHNLPRAFAEERQRAALIEPIPIDPLARLVRTKKRVHISDARAEKAYKIGFPPFVAAVDDGGVRTLLLTPLLRKGELIGAFAIFRQEVRSFSGKHIELVDNFAAQAVIAIENTRLLNELRESLQQQTATADVLKVISRSTFDLQTVLNTLVESAAKLCGAYDSGLFLRQGDRLCHRAHYGDIPAEVIDLPYTKANDWPISRDWVTGRAFVDRVPIHIHDLQQCGDEFPDGTKMARRLGHRTILAVPMLREDEAVGAIVIRRMEARPFTEKQIELLTTFADQAVIAIENARLFDEVQARTRDLSESLDQQTATSEVLKVISSSQGELDTVFQTLLDNATRICEAAFGSMLQREGEMFRRVALHNAPAAFAEFHKRTPVIDPRKISDLKHVVETKRVVHVADTAAEHPDAPIAKYAGGRTLLLVPMLKDEELIGIIGIYRQEVRPFTDKQIELVQNFAAQAVIAIENTRLLNELRESLQQQTATSDVLKVISSSPGDLVPVFDAMLEKATSICGAKFGTMFLSEGDCARVVAQFRAPPAYAEVFQREPVITLGEGALGRVTRTRQAVQIADIRIDPAYVKDPRRLAILELAGARTLITVPMLNNNEVVGLIAIYRQEVLPFTDKQVEVVKNFAAQAVIAIENARLLSELRQRTDDLTESLEQQTATSEVLRVISSSPGELEPVFQAMLQNARRICEAEFGVLYRREGDAFRAVAMHGAPQAFVEERRSNPLIRPPPQTTLGRVMATKQPVQISDIVNEPHYFDVPSGYSAVLLTKLSGARTVLAVPMLKEDELIGAVVIYRTEVRPFTDKQIELVRNFAAQAVIAIENTRLLNELRESLQQQTATADVLKVISRSTFNLQTVLQTLVESVARLCDADKTIITREKNGVFYRSEAYGFSREFMDYVKDTPIKPERGSSFGRALLEGRVVHIPDVNIDPEYTLHDHSKLGDYRTILSVPMVRESVSIGVVTLCRSEVRPFTEKQIELATTFADQAAIAIENVRLFERVEARTRELAKSLEELRNTQDRLVQTQKLASLGQLTAGIAHEMKNPLNFVNNFSVVSSELIDELQQSLKDVSLDDNKRSEVAELMETLRGNLGKVVQHGQRADAIVKNMLQHSREGTGEHRAVDINALVEESLNLAWHGARAEKQGFEIALKQSFDPSVGDVDVFPQDIRRALLNLISNGFYAATKRMEAANGDYEPVIVASTKNLGDRVEIRIRDNGTGIAPDVKDKIFNPFFTTKPTGEGTGLGLSISHDIIVKQHAGSIEVDTLPGEFTEITVILPRAAIFV